MARVVSKLKEEPPHGGSADQDTCMEPSLQSRLLVVPKIDPVGLHCGVKLAKDGLVSKRHNPEQIMTFNLNPSRFF